MAFLLFYYIIQFLYQLDLHVVCSLPQLNSTLEASTLACRENNKARFKLWGKERDSYLSLLTFLLGFYVANIVSRWTQEVSFRNITSSQSAIQVQGIPDAESPQLMLGGLVRHQAGQPQTAVTSATGVLEARKMVARYCLLAWTMCYNTFRGPLADEYSTTGQLLDKGLLQDRERTALQVLIVLLIICQPSYLNSHIALKGLKPSK